MVFPDGGGRGKDPGRQTACRVPRNRTWIAAPGIREILAQACPADHLCLHSCTGLKSYLTEIAASAQARNPPILASQLVILLQGAIAEEMRNPAAGTLDEAANAARAVIARACDSHRKQRRLVRSMGGLTAAAVLVAAASLHPLTRQALNPVAPQPAAMPQHAPALVASMPTGASPDEIAAILALQRSIEEGRCPAPQLLALPQGQVTAYMNAINFRTPDNPAADQANMRAFLAWFRQTRSSECYFPPSNGHTTVAWLRR